MALVLAIFPPKGKHLSGCDNRGVRAAVGPHQPPGGRAAARLPSLPEYVPLKPTVQVGQPLSPHVHR